MKQEAKRIFDGLLERLPEIKNNGGDILSLFELLSQCYSRGGKLLLCGSGGSAADSGHIAGELMKGFLLKRPVPSDVETALARMFPEDGRRIAACLQQALPAISLPDQTSVMTAFANDVAADMAFAQLTYGYGKPGDVLLGISTSGNSAGVVNAAKTAKALGLGVAGLTGSGGGKLASLCDAVFKAPSNETYRIQEYHLCVYHALCAMLEHEFFGE